MQNDITEISDEIDVELKKILLEAAQKTVQLLDRKLFSFQERLNVLTSKNEIICDDECADFISSLVFDCVIFTNNEADEHLAFLAPSILEALKAQNELERFNPSKFWDEGDNLMMCQMVLKVARRHFDLEYKGKSPAVGGISWALLQAAEWYKNEIEHHKRSQ